ncbi:hypothetical protein GCM10020229_62560 [Kitasatospora albolonga]|uniref:hypothetical protein n=1 Tax=Kitasatospora albolonga TaxID=68173 RepID=UPI0031E71628
MGIFLTVCAALVATASAYRLGYRLRAERPPVRTPRPTGTELTVYEVAALRSWPLHPDSRLGGL